MRNDGLVLPEKGKSRKSRARYAKALAEYEKEQRRHDRERRRERIEKAGVDLRRQVRRAAAVDLAKIRRDVFGEAMVEGVRRQRLSDLIHVLLDRSPRLLDPVHGVALKRLIGIPWRRRAEDWVPTAKGDGSRLSSLVLHLVGKYPVPRFLMDAFLAEDDVGGLCPVADVFRELTAGRSVLHCVRSGVIPLPLTRRMGHIFLESPRGCGLDWALQRALVLGYGGSEALAQALRRARVAWWEDREFAAGVVHWFCRQEDVDLVQVHPLLDYIRHRRTESPDFRLKGQTAERLLKRMHAWHAELHRQRTETSEDKELALKPLHVDPCRWIVKGEDGEPVTWSVTPILTVGQLVTEGRKQRHCVASYAGSIKRGSCSIWSLRRNHVRKLTIQVSRDGTIVQARGVCNRLPTPQEATHLSRWARKNKLRLIAGPGRGR